MSRLPAQSQARNPRSALPVSRTARSVTRPVKIDLTGAPGRADPLAPMVPWGVAAAARGAEPANLAAQVAGDEVWGNGMSGGFGAGGSAGHVPLSDLVDKAGAQLVTLRRTLDDAAAADRIVRAHMTDLMQRMQQGQRFGAEFDQRLVSAGKAAGMLEKAAATLQGLEAVVDQIRNAQGAMEQRVYQKLAEHETSVQARLDAVTARYEAMLARIDGAATEAQVRAAERVDELERGVKADLDALTATIDRRAAQTQARTSVILDSASDRLDTMDRQAAELGGRAAREVEALCEKAARLLGHDPRAAQGAEPAVGSLGHAVARAEELIAGVDDSAVRIAAGRTAAEHTIEKLESVRLAAESVAENGMMRQESLRQSIEAALERTREVDASLQRALVAQADAVQKSDQASTLLLRQREDLGAIAEAGRYHVEQARSAEASLRAEIESASVRSASLKRAVEDVSDQAANLVGLARDVAVLIARAEAVDSVSNGTPGGT